MTEMRHPDANQPGLASQLDDLLADGGNDDLAEVLEQARSAWFSAPEPEPSAALRGFLADAAQPSQPGSTRARDRWSSRMFTNLTDRFPTDRIPTDRLPSAGRAAFGASLAAVAAAIALIGVGLGGGAPGPDELGPLGSPTEGSESSNSTTSTTGVVGSASALERSATVIPVGDAGTAEIAIVDGELVLLGADPAEGWEVVEESPDEPNEIDLSYRRGSDRVDLDIEIDDGQIRIRIRDRRTDTEVESYLGDGDLSDLFDDDYHDGYDDDRYDDDRYDEDDDSHDDDGYDDEDDRDDDGETVEAEEEVEIDDDRDDSGDDD